jgi:hypothetical protein
MALEFTPSEVSGIPAVLQVAVFHDRLELCSEGQTRTGGTVTLG